MNKYANILILLSFLSILGASYQANAEIKKSWWGWSKGHNHYREMKNYHPHLENSRHVQVPQWAHEDWYAEDWTAQKGGNEGDQSGGMKLIQGFYSADILRDQTTGHSELPVLVVGPNFYRLSGYDKRRVVHIVDVVYGITEAKHDGSFLLTDWNTRRPIGVFDQNGLRLH